MPAKSISESIRASSTPSADIQEQTNVGDHNNAQPPNGTRKKPPLFILLFVALIILDISIAATHHGSLQFALGIEVIFIPVALVVGFIVLWPFERLSRYLYDYFIGFPSRRGYDRSLSLTLSLSLLIGRAVIWWLSQN